MRGESDVFKVYVIYDSKYGNTKRVAEQILKGLRLVEGVEAEISYAKTVDTQTLLEYDGFILGAPNHMGKPSRAITKFVDRLAELDLKATEAAAFDTYFKRQQHSMKAASKLEKHIRKKLPKLKLLPGFSVKVNGVSGPIADGELEKALEFGEKTAKYSLYPAEKLRL